MKQVYKENLQYLYLFFVLLFLSTNVAAQRGASATTGWNYNDKKNGGFSTETDFRVKRYKTPRSLPKDDYNPYVPFVVWDHLAYIEGGTFTMGRVEEDVMHDWNNSPTKQTVRSFYMDITEVTNLDYREYLYWISRVFPSDDENFKYIYKSALPDTLVWRERLGANEAYVNNYLRHPAFNNYPVVGVSWIQATKYAEWRTDRVNEKILMNKGIIREDVNGSKDKIVYGENNFNTNTYFEDPSLVFKDQDQDVYDKKNLLPNNSPSEDTKGPEMGRHATIQDGLLLPKFRLPTEAEWEYAAGGLIDKRVYEIPNSIKGKGKFPWDGKRAKVNPNRKRYGGKKVSAGDFLANYKLSKGDYSGIAGYPADGYIYTSPVATFPPNDFGLYDMAGNVAEWVADVYRPVIDNEANDINYFRGNVFEKKDTDENGQVKIIGDDAIVYDTLSDGTLMPHRLPGDIAMVPIDDDDTYMRYNYSKADNIDYNDGDLVSGKNYNVNPNEVNKSKMYNSPENILKVDANGRVIRSYDKSNDRTSLINDKVRVYKGGSWKDRIYWLDPAQRRYLQQDRATNFIGFRCAMDKIGEEEIEMLPPSRHNKKNK